MYIRFSNLRSSQRKLMNKKAEWLDRPSLDRIIKLPWNVRRAEDQHTSIIMTHTVHLHQELRLDAS